MKPGEFEEYVADLFSRLGFKTEAVGRSHDGGVDVIAEKDGIKHYIQCKKFITQEVGVGAIRDFYGAIANHLAQGKGYFVTTNKFTLEAEKFAEDKPIELIDGQKIIKYIRLVEKENNGSEFLSREATINKCPRCGGTIVKREGKFGRFYGCSNYPKCRFTKGL
jgi:restriction system protein